MGAAPSQQSFVFIQGVVVGWATVTAPPELFFCVFANFYALDWRLLHGVYMYTPSILLSGCFAPGYALAKKEIRAAL
jgi:hypothetical protein